MSLSYRGLSKVFWVVVCLAVLGSWQIFETTMEGARGKNRRQDIVTYSLGRVWKMVMSTRFHKPSDSRSFTLIIAS